MKDLLREVIFFWCKCLLLESVLLKELLNRWKFGADLVRLLSAIPLPFPPPLTEVLAVAEEELSTTLSQSGSHDGSITTIRRRGVTLIIPLKPKSQSKGRRAVLAVRKLNSERSPASLYSIAYAGDFTQRGYNYD